MKIVAILLIIGFCIFGLLKDYFDKLYNPRKRLDPEEEKQKRQERRNDEMRHIKEQRERQKEIDIAEADRLLNSSQDLIHKFMEITFRKVSLLDDYGDESWGVLPKQIIECLIKIGEREGINSSQIRDWFKKNETWRFEHCSGREKQFRELAKRLESSYNSYHKEQKSNLSLPIDFENLSGRDFESFIARILPTIGFQDVRGTPATGDQGADLIAQKDGRRFIIQIKGQRSPVGNKAVQEVVAALKFYLGDEGWVITNSVFTPAANALAQKNAIRLIDGVLLKQLIQKSSMVGTDG